MNTGRLCKNLTDGLLIAIAILALVCLVVRYVGFEEYVTKDPVTKEQVTISTVFEDPYFMTYAKLFATFAMAAVIGFTSRGNGWVGILASICAVVISVNYFADGTILKFGFIYVLMAVTGLGGSLVHSYFWYTEERNHKVSDEKQI